ncbi:MAG: cytochrome c [Myxococcota bacterium]
MKTARTKLLAAVVTALVFTGLFGCDKGGDSADETAEATPEAQGSEEPAPESQSEAKEATPQPAASGPYAELESMDGRKPVPLTPMMANHQRQQMRDHLVAVQGIVAAAATDDFEGVEQAATKIGSSPQMKQMCNHMGAGAEGFTERALGFHETADGIIEAAQNKDKKAVMVSLEKTLQTCTSCHAEYKQQVVSPGEWNEITGMGAPSGGGGGMPGGHHGR